MESERRTRKERINPRLDAAGWPIAVEGAKPISRAYRSEEEETASGPADYALWLNDKIVGIVEAKKVSLSTQEVLRQSGRYGRADGVSSPFLYSTNGEVIWFRDARHDLNLARKIAAFHTPAALSELLGSDFDAECQKLRALPNDQERLRLYQRDCNAAIEEAIAKRKRNLLVAMATGTGKTYTMVNQVYRLMKSGVARRVLFLVDRRALAAQAVRAFSAYDAEPGMKFHQVYEVYSSRFRAEDL